jgi:spore germination cell wall hydrolase CwlJ-like protein
MQVGIVIDIAIACLAMNVYFEARDQSIAGQVAVAQVTMNRVASPDYPNDVCSVVQQHKQFSWFWDGKSDVPQESMAWKRAQMVAEGVMNGSGHAELMDVNITHYHAAYVSPYWSKKMQLVAQIGDHIFYTPSRRSGT